MTTSSFWTLVCASLPFITAISQGRVATRLTASSDLPNILVLVADDISLFTPGCYGDSLIRTPHLDGLAQEGMRLNRAYVVSAQCSPSRSAIFAGRTPHAIGTSRLHAELRSDVPTIVEPLRARGYFTGMYRKNHLGDDFLKRLDFYGDSKTSFATFFDRVPQGRPFFLWVGFTDPHRSRTNYDHIKAPQPHDHYYLAGGRWRAPSREDGGSQSRAAADRPTARITPLCVR